MLHWRVAAVLVLVDAGWKGELVEWSCHVVNEPTLYMCRVGTILLFIHTSYWREEVYLRGRYISST